MFIIKNMIKKVENTMFEGRESSLKRIRKDLDLSKEKMGKFFLDHGIKKIGNRTYIKIENGEEKFHVDKFKDMAKAFNREFRKRNDSRSIIFTTLIKSSGKLALYRANQQLREKEWKKREKNSYQQENETITTSTQLKRIYNAENMLQHLSSEKTHKKKVFGLGSLKSAPIANIENLFNFIKDYYKSKKNDQESTDELSDFSVENKFLKVSSDLNKVLADLHTAGIRLYMGVLPINYARPIPAKIANTKENLAEVTLAGQVDWQLCSSTEEYLFYYFTRENPEYIGVTYKNQYSTSMLKSILDKYSITIKANANKFIAETDNNLFVLLKNKIFRMSDAEVDLHRGIREENIKFHFQSTDDWELPPFDIQDRENFDYLDEQMEEFAAANDTAGGHEKI